MRQAICDFMHSFGSKTPPELLSTFFTSNTGERSIFENGPAWATARLPFLGQEFVGTAGCLKYFEKLGETLKMHPTAKLPVKENVAVDEEQGTASVKMEGVTFESVATGKKWTEVNVHRFEGLAADHDADGQVRFKRWEIYADPLSAWMACER